MQGLPSRERTKGAVPVQNLATLGTKPRRSIARKTLAVGLVGAVHAIFGGVIWAAYHEFGDRSLRNFPPLVLADRTPLKLLPGEVEQEDTSPPDRTRSKPSDALAPGPGDPASPDSQIVPAITPSPNDGRGSPADPLVMTERRAMAPFDIEPGAVDGGAAEQRSVAASGRAAAPRSAEAPAEAAATDALPPTPAVKPLEFVPTVVVEATVAPDPPVTPDPIRLTALMFDPPTPALKPIGVPSSVRSGPLPSPNDEAAASQVVARSKQSLPVALRAWWTKVKLLLASTQASRVRPANSSGGGQGGFQGSFGASVASADSGHGDAAGASGGGSGSSGRGNTGGGASGGGSSAGGGATGGGSGVSGGGNAGGGASGGGSSASGCGKGGGGGKGHD